jgi:hypothetical protein
MGRQIEILATADDVLELLRVAAAEGARAVPERIPPDDPPELGDAASLFRETPQKRLYLLPGSLAAVEIMAIDIPDQPGEAKVNDRTSPVVEFLPPTEQDGSLRSGRLYVALSPSDRLFPDVERLYKKLVAVTDDWERANENDVRVGPRAAERAQSEGLQLQLRTGERVQLRPGGAR